MFEVYDNPYAVEDCMDYCMNETEDCRDYAEDLAFEAVGFDC